LAAAAIGLFLLSNRSGDVTLTAKSSTTVVEWIVAATDKDPFILALPSGALFAYDLEPFNVAAENADGIYKFVSPGLAPSRLEFQGPALIVLTADKEQSAFILEARPAENDKGERSRILIRHGDQAPLLFDGLQASVTMSCADGTLRSQSGCAPAGTQALIDADHLKIGRDVSESAMAPDDSLVRPWRLLEGSLLATSKALFSERRYSIAQEALDAGDVVILTAGSRPAPHAAGAAGEGAARIRGVVVWANNEDRGPYFEVIAHTKAKNITVTHFGGSYKFGAALLHILVFNPVVQTIVAFVASAIAFFAAILAILKDWRERASARKQTAGPAEHPEKNPPEKRPAKARAPEPATPPAGAVDLPAQTSESAGPSSPAAAAKQDENRGSAA
jgi:hypothetical protein